MYILEEAWDGRRIMKKCDIKKSSFKVIGVYLEQNK